MSLRFIRVACGTVAAFLVGVFVGHRATSNAASQAIDEMTDMFLWDLELAGVDIIDVFDNTGLEVNDEYYDEEDDSVFPPD